MPEKTRATSCSLPIGARIVRAFVAALVAAALPATAAREHTPKPVIDTASLARLVHNRVNQERKAHRLSSLSFDNALSQIAEQHSRDMSERNYFAHASPEGDGFAQRYQRGGYRCAIQIGNLIHGGAENLAFSHLHSSVTTVNGEDFYDWRSADAIAKVIVEGWMKSPGHRKNILTGHWKNEGIGISIGRDGKVYATQNFC